MAKKKQPKEFFLKLYLKKSQDMDITMTQKQPKEFFPKLDFSRNLKMWNRCRKKDQFFLYLKRKISKKETYNYWETQKENNKTNNYL